VSLARNALLNLAGLAAPLAAAVFAVPALVVRLGADRFGFLAIAWVLVGYFSLFDLGLGRSLSRLIAAREGGARAADLPELAHTALTLSLALGVGAGALLFAAAELVCTRLLKLPFALQPEAEAALRVLACCLPFVTLTSALRGVLEAGQRFGWVNAIRVPLGVLTFVAPLAAAAATPSLVALALALAALRVAALAAHWGVAAKLYPDLVRVGVPALRAAREVLGAGAWITVSNLVGPLMMYLDRFVIGALLAVSAVAYYTAPYEVVTRLSLLPAALTSVLFPAFAAAAPDRAAALSRMGVKAIAVVLFPILLGAVLFAPEWMRAWLGTVYAQRGARVAQLLCLGVMANSLAYLPFTLLQARGRADLPAKAHLVELPCYVALLALFVPTRGIEGAALAWTLRCAADAAVLFALAHRHLGRSAPRLAGPQAATLAVALTLLAGSLLPVAPATKLLYFALALAAFVPLAWRVLLDAGERALARELPARLGAGWPQ